MNSLLDSLSEWAALRADGVAYRFLETGDVDGASATITFGQLGERARAIGGWLQEHGYAGSRALLLYPAGLEFVSGYMGCLFGGVVAVPCAAPHPANFERELQRLKRLIADAAPDVVLSSEPFLSAVRSMASEVPELAALTWVATADIPDQAQEAWRRPELGSSSVAFLQYTSGSTSAPRGVMVSHGNLMDQQRMLATCLGHTPGCLASLPGDLIVSWLPVFHDLGLIANVLHALYLGQTAVMFPPEHFVQRPDRWLRAISRYRAHTAGGPNFAFELCVRRATPELVESLDLDPWLSAFNCAEPVRASTIRRFAEVFGPAGFRRTAFYPSYGLAEATLAVTGGDPEGEPRIIPAPGGGGRELVSVGRARPGVSLVVVDPETGAPRAGGEVGEIWIAGASVALGYWNDPAATAAVFDARLPDGRTGYLRTGDLGFLRDGELYVTGRAKDLMIVDGRNHYPQDLELTAELAHPAVRPGCIAAFSVDGGDAERAVIVAEVAPKRMPDPREVEAAIRRAIDAEHGLALRSIALIMPRTIFKTSSGKIQRAATRKAYLEGTLAPFEAPAEPDPAPAEPDPAPAPASPPAAVAPAEVEAWLTAAVARRLEGDPAEIEVDRPIADYGLGSRALVELVGELGALLGRDLETTLLYDYPTIARAARAIGAAENGASAPRAPSTTEPIAIVALACRFPGGANSPEELWRLLRDGVDAVGGPPGRWDAGALHDSDPDAAGKAYTLEGGFLSDVDRFDARFFGIAPREAAAMDPQQRLLLEASWEALERAGIRPHELSDTATGVYVGLYDSGYSAGMSLEQLDGHTATGSAASVASGRIAYTLGLQGPAVTLDTACSSSLVAVHMAAQGLRGGECDLALAGGATVMATPRAFVEFSRLRGLSPSGRCRPFSSAADGIVWGEGCGLLVLKRLADAERDGDRVLALIAGSAINQDGRSQGLSAPNGLAQERVVRAALDVAELRPEDVDYVEAHGTGTPLGDPIEGRALARVFGASRPPERPLYVGSLKSNLGHTQAAAGVGGVIKAVLALQHEELPPSLHGEAPAAPVDGSAGVELLTRGMPWPRGARDRCAGVSSFGISGTNAHLVLREPPDRPSRVADEPAPAGLEPTLFPLSARSPGALAGQAARLAAALEADPRLDVRSVARTLSCHRTSFERRAAVVGRSREDLLGALRSLADGRPDPELVAGPGEGPISGKLAFVFPGQGAQWAGMAADLLARSAAFRDELARCDEALRQHLGWSVESALRGAAAAPDLSRVDVIQPVLFAVMVSLAAVWRSFGVEPDAVIGHSQGEVAAACVAGALTLDEAASVVAHRARALSSLGGSGAMAVVALPHDEVQERLAPLEPDVSVAAINSARATVVTGDPAGLETFLAGLGRDGVFARRLQVDYASHSPAVEPLREPIVAGLAAISSRPPAVGWYSTVLGEEVDGRPLDADYWYRNLREPVRFAAAVERMCGDGFRHFVELSPHPSLLMAIDTIAGDAGLPVVAVGSLRREGDGLGSLMRSLSELHVAGRDLRWERIAPAAHRVELPTYAFDGERYWIEPAGGAPAAPAGAHPLLGVQVESAGAERWISRRVWSSGADGWLRDHRVFDRVVLSGTTVMELCQAAADAALPDRATDVTELVMTAPLVLPREGALEVQVEAAVSAEPGAGLDVAVYSRPSGGEPAAWTRHATAVAAPASPLAAGSPPDWPDGATPLWTESSYARLAEAGLSYGPAFQGVRTAVATGEGSLLARLSLPPQARDGATAGRVHPALLDAALHVAVALETSGRALVPVAVGRCSLPREEAEELVAAVDSAAASSGDVVLDVTLWSVDGFPVGRLEGVRLRPIAAGELDHASAARDLYAVRWTPRSDPVQAEGGHWAVVAEAGDPRASAVLGALREAGLEPTPVEPGAELPPEVDVTVRCLPGASVPDGPDELDSLADRSERFTADGLAELVSLARTGAGRVVWITSGAVATGAGDPRGGLLQSPLWGAARSARSEHPDLALELVDVGEDAGAAALLAALCDRDEPELAVRGERVLAPRLVRCPPDDDPRVGAADRSVVPTDGTVLISGGLGAIGARIARRLAEHGVPRLLLASRHGEQDPRAAGVVAELSALGATVDVAACDVADAGALGALLRGIDPRLPLRGVVHCAGVLSDALLTDQSPERLAEVMRPKAAGAWNLHRLTLDQPLALFALISSVAGVVGSAGQSNYAAANAFLDRLAHERQALGLPATSISFGPWSDGGLAEDSLARSAGRGFAPLAPDHGLELFDLSIRRERPHLVATIVDLERVRSAHAGAVPALWRTLLPRPRAGETRGSLAERLATLAAPERAERVLAVVSEEAARVLGLGSAREIPPERPLGELGLDSLMALELRNRLGARFGARLPATLLFDRPAPRDLAAHLMENVLTAAEPRPAAGPRPARPTSRSADEPIAIVSMACRLPGGVADPDGLWELLDEGRDAIGPFPADRWDVDSLYDPDPDAAGKSYARDGGFLGRIDAFDAGFFGITPREATAMDPQQRLLLETAWEALERGGIVPAGLAGSPTGVYLGMLGSDYAMGRSLNQLDGYAGTGNALSVASGRLAYALGLVGPALTVDTACSSSLLALHLAAAGLRSGECELALVGGATVMTTPRTFVEFSRLRGLAPSGRSRSFSDDADGTGFSEGVAVIVAKRLSDARRDRDDVLAVVRGTAVNQDGRSQGLSVPFGPSQEQVVRRALERSSLTPADVDYVEAHGTGTMLGDPIEANALAQVFGPTRPDGRRVRLGSIKSNVGHLQAAAGLAGVMKVVLAMQHERIPPTLHVSKPTRHVEWEESGLRLVREPEPWPRADRPRRAGVSSFGISGTNVHAIVEEAPRVEGEERAPEPARTVPFLVTARDDAALSRHAELLAAHVAARPGLAAADVASALARDRTHFERRAVVLAGDRDELLAGLDAVAAGRAGPDVLLPGGEPVGGKVAFVFPGHSPRWAGMGADLLERSEPFAGALERCDEAIRRYVDWSVLAVVRGEADAPDMGRVDVIQPVTFALHCALTALWRAQGVEPEAVVGHSFGEIAAAHVAGALSLDQAAAIVSRRALSLRPAEGRGGLLSVELPGAEVEERLAAFGGRLSVAAVNSGRSTAVAGDLATLDELKAALAADGLSARRVPVPFAAHSAQMDPIAQDLRAQLDGIAGGAESLALYSTVLGERVAGDALDADYWARNLREPIRFAAALRRMLDDGYRSFVEVAPHPALGPSVESVALDAGMPVAAVGSLRRDEDGRASMLRNLARLAIAGHDPDWSKVFPERRRVELPTYPFARERFWSPPEAAHSAGPADTPLVHAHVTPSDEPERDIFEAEVDLRDPRFAYLGDHRVGGAIWLPAAAFLEMAFEAADTLRPGARVTLADVRFDEPLPLAEGEPARVQLILGRPGADGARLLTIASRAAGPGGAAWTTHVTGTLLPEEAEPAAVEPIEAQRARCTTAIAMADVYAGLAKLGIEYGAAFQRLRSGWSGQGEAVGRLSEGPPVPGVIEPALLDAAFHAAALPAEMPSGTAFVPAGLGRVRLGEVRTAPAWVTCSVRSTSPERVLLDLRLLDSDERPVVHLEGVELAPLSPRERSLYEVRWKPRPPAEGAPPRGGWLILSDESGVGAAIGERLGAQPHAIARRGDAFRAEGPGRYRIAPDDPAGFDRLLADAFAGGPPERVVALFGLDARPIDSPRAMTEAAGLCCGATLHLVRAMTERGWSPRLFVVTRGSQAAAGSAAVANPEQALGWGFGATVAQEHPELRTTLIDLPPSGGVDALWAELRHADGERWVALRDSGRLVPRLVPAHPDDSGAPVAGDRTYLVTGGLGGLGRIAGERLVKRGARHLALVGRSEPSAEALAWIRAREAEGVAVHVLRADVADRDALAAALGDLRGAAPAIGGIVHAAGIVEDATLGTLTSDRIGRVLAPKVLGAALLTELVPESELLVLFSSAAGLLGSPGQAAYAAANAFLDAWAHHLAGPGRAALSLDWGPWGEVGMVADVAARSANTARSGLGSFSSEEGGELFERVLASDRRQLAPVALERAALARHPELVETRPLLADLVPRAPQPAGQREIGRLVRAAAGPGEQRALVETYLRGALGDVTGADMSAVESTTVLQDLELDSLMRVTLGNAIARDLGVELPARAALGAGDIESLAGSILAALEEAGPDHAPAPEPAGTPAAAGAVPEVERLPATRDVMRLLRAEEQGTPSVTHNIGFAVRLGTPTTRGRLTELLDGLAARHAALRTAIVRDSDQRQQLEVRRRPAGELLRWSKLDGELDVDARLRELMEPPFDLTSSPLWRFELLESGSGDQVLIYGAHHAVADLTSLVLVMSELDAGLSGGRMEAVASNRDVEALLRAQPAQGTAERDAAIAEWRAQVSGCRRLDLTLAGPRPAERSFRAASLFVELPDGLVERVDRQAGRLGITPAAFWLGALTVFLARERARSRFVLAVPVDTRVHAGAFDAVGFFGVPIPFAAEVGADEAVADVLRRTDGRLDQVLEKGASFFDAMPALMAEGLYRPNAPLVEVYFNFIRPRVRPRGVEVLQAGTGYSDLDLMLTVAPDLGHVRLDYNLDIVDADGCARLGHDYLALLDRIAGDPSAPAAPPAAPAAPPSIALAATFAHGKLPGLLSAALEDGEPGLEVAEAPYHQVLASLLDPSGAFRRPSTAVGVALLRAGDLTRFGSPTDELLAELADEYPAAVRAVAEQRPVIVGFLPDRSPDPRLCAWEDELAARLREDPGTVVVGRDDWTREHPVADRFDAETDAIAHLPFRLEFQAAVALTLAARVRAIRRRPPKLIAVDGDETLWGGVAGEVGPENVDLGGPRAALARRLLEWRAAGVLLVLMSNNDEPTVRAVLERPESVLRAEHFSAISAAWEPKVRRLEAVAHELRLGVADFLYIDDNPVEIAAIRSELPEVLCVTAPPADELEPFLDRLWPLIPRAATREDAARADFYRQEEERRGERERNGFEEFLERLELELDVLPLAPETLERSVQLSRRTNQFNLRPGELDEAALERSRRDGEVWTASARDRFGDYGQIGVVVIRVDGEALEVVAWMLSCRVLGRGVEERVLHWLADRAEALGCTAVRLVAESTPRNVPARRLVAALGGGDVDAPRLVATVTPAELRAFRSWDAEAAESIGARGD